MRRGLIQWLPEEMPAAQLEARVARLQAAMAGEGLAAVLAYTSFAQPAAVHWLTHFTPYWSEALLVVPASGPPVLLAALTPRVHGWIREVSHLGELVSAPKPGAAAVAWLAEHAPADARVGVVGLDVLSWSVAQPLVQALGPRLVDANALFRQVRQPADAAERALAARAATLAGDALRAIPAQVRSSSQLAAAADASARLAGAEEVLLRVAPDLAQDGALRRLDGELPLGERFAVELSVAYKGVWVRLARSFTRGGDEPEAWSKARAWFDAAASGTRSLAALIAGDLPPPEGCSLRWTLESCIGLQPLSVIGSSEPGFPATPALPAGTLCTLGIALAGADGHWISSEPLAVVPEGLQRLAATPF